MDAVINGGHKQSTIRGAIATGQKNNGFTWAYETVTDN